MTPPGTLIAFWELDADPCLPNGAEILDEEDFADINDMVAEFEWESPVLPVIAVDGGLGYFLLDANDEMGGGAGAVWWIERDLTREGAFVAAASFADFVAMPHDDPAIRWAPA